MKKEIAVDSNLRNKFWEYYEDEPMLDLVEKAVDLVKDELGEEYEEVKSWFKKGSDKRNFLRLEDNIKDLDVYIDDADDCEKAQSVLLSYLYSFWVASIQLRLSQKAHYCRRFSFIWKEELVKHLDFSELLRLIQALEDDDTEENEKKIIAYLEENYSDELKYFVFWIKKFLDFEKIEENLLKHLVNVELQKVFFSGLYGSYSDEYPLDNIRMRNIFE